MNNYCRHSTGYSILVELNYLVFPIDSFKYLAIFFKKDHYCGIQGQGCKISTDPDLYDISFEGLFNVVPT